MPFYVLFFSGLLMNIAHYILNPRKYDKVVEGLEKTGENVNHYAFYETYLERTNATGNFKFNYENLSTLNEVAIYQSMRLLLICRGDNNIYLKHLFVSGIFII